MVEVLIYDGHGIASGMKWRRVPPDKNICEYTEKAAANRKQGVVYSFQSGYETNNPSS
jgi:hypothetical protein